LIANWYEKKGKDGKQGEIGEKAKRKAGWWKTACLDFP
jgi:hypothetical protein